MIKKIFFLGNLSFLSIFHIVLSIIFIALLEIIGLGLFFIFIKSFISGNDFFNSSYLKFLNELNFNLSTFLILIAITFILRFFLTLFLNYIVFRFSIKNQYFLKLRLLKKLSMANIKEVYKVPNAKLLNIFNNHMNLFGGSLESFFRLIADIFLLIVIVFFLAFINLKIILIAILLFISTFLLLKITIIKKIKKLGIDYNRSLNFQFIKIKDFFTGIQSIKIFDQVSNYIKNIDNFAKSVYLTSLQRSFYNSIPRQVFELVVILFMLFVIAFLIESYTKDEILEIIGLFLIALPRFIPSLNNIVNHINNLRFSNESIIELYNLFTNKNFKPIYPNKIISNFQKIEIKNISYKIPKTNKILFNLKKLTINKNQVIGIHGSTGVGKTTLVNLLIGQIPLTNGAIDIDDSQFTNKFTFNLSNVAYVPQEYFIFEGSIHENITFEKNLRKIKKKKFQDSVNFAQLKDFYIQNKNKLIYDNGMNLSGGQRQRISIARAYYHNKDFLVFDEPTSSLDESTESSFIEILEKYKKYFTIVIISHRRKTLSFCDTNYKIENNNVVKLN